MTINKFLKWNLSVKLLVILISTLLFGHWLPQNLQSILYAISLTLKEILLFVLPVIIFSYLFSSLLTLQSKKAIVFMLFLFGAVCISNYISTLIAYGVGSIELIQLSSIIINNTEYTDQLVPLWNFELPKWISNNQALCFGFSLGLLLSFFQISWIHKFSDYAKIISSLFIEKYFIPVLPLFSLGFFVKMQHEGILNKIIQSFLPIMVIVMLTCLLYLAILYALAAKFDFKQWLKYIKNALPAALTGFSTMSSLAAMPITLKAAEKNTQGSNFVRVIIPTTVNIHMIGDSIIIPFLTLSILVTFGYKFPWFETYNYFAVSFLLTKFSAAGIPGGTILVMLPVIEAHLNFSGEMSALITTLCILFDPVVTMMNVLGNNVFVIILCKIFMKIKFLVVKNVANSKIIDVTQLLWFKKMWRKKRFIQ